MSARRGWALSPLAHGLLWLVLAGLLTSSGAIAGDWVAQLQSDDVRARIQACRALGDEGEAKNLEFLANTLASDTDPGVRMAAQHAMARTNAGPEQLAAVLASSPEPIARAWAAHALGRVGTPDVADALLEALGDEDELVRGEVYDALANTGDARALKALSKAAVKDPSSSLRARAEQAALRAARAPYVDVHTDLALLQSGDSADRAMAARRLGDFGDWRATEPLLNAAASGPSELRREAMLALGRLDDHRAVPELIRLADRSAGPDRYHAIAALAHIADESAVPALVGLTRSSDEVTRQLAVRAIAWTDPVDLLERLEPQLDDPAESVRTEVVLALGRSASPEREALLITALKDRSPFLRAEAARMLGSTSSGAGPALIEALADVDALVRLAATRSLVELGFKQAIPPLTERAEQARDDEERASYLEAIQALGG